MYDHIDVYVLSCIRMWNQYHIYHFGVSQCYSSLRMPRPHCWHCKYWTSSHVTLTTVVEPVLHKCYIRKGTGSEEPVEVVSETETWYFGDMKPETGQSAVFFFPTWQLVFVFVLISQYRRVLQTELWTGWLSFVMSTLVRMPPCCLNKLHVPFGTGTLFSTVNIEHTQRFYSVEITDCPDRGLF